MSKFIKLKGSANVYVNIDHIIAFEGRYYGTEIKTNKVDVSSTETAKEFYERLKEIKAFGKPLEDVGDIQKELLYQAAENMKQELREARYQI